MEKAMVCGEFVGMIRNSNRFQKLEDGWVKDALLGIDWGPSSKETMTWEEAKKYAAKQGGRLPERLELITLIDDTKRRPTINTEFFADTKTDDWYWTGTAVAGNEGNAWVVGFGGGGVYGLYKSNSLYVRPVRASQ